MTGWQLMKALRENSAGAYSDVKLCVGGLTWAVTDVKVVNGVVLIMPDPMPEVIKEFGDVGDAQARGGALSGSVGPARLDAPQPDVGELHADSGEHDTRLGGLTGAIYEDAEGFAYVTS